MFKIVGADLKEYGPVAEEQIRQWIAEGRANAQTIARYGDGPWKPLATFPEFASAFGAVGPGTPLPPLALPPATGAGSTGAAAPPTHGMAVAGLVCSILGATCATACCSPLFSTAGLVLSAVALSQINQQPLRYSGKGVAVAGIALGLFGYLLFAALVWGSVLKRRLRHIGFPV
jgi:hypothetical protein